MAGKVELTEAEQRLFLECLYVHANEGFYDLGHYGFEGKREDACEVGCRLCRSLGIPLEGRHWLT